MLQYEKHILDNLDAIVEQIVNESADVLSLSKNEYHTTTDTEDCVIQVCQIDDEMNKNEVKQYILDKLPVFKQILERALTVEHVIGQSIGSLLGDAVVYNTPVRILAELDEEYPCITIDSHCYGEFTQLGVIEPVRNNSTYLTMANIEEQINTACDNFTRMIRYLLSEVPDKIDVHE